MKKVLFAYVLCFAFFSIVLTACSNGDDYLYDEEQSTFIEVSAEMAYSFDPESSRLKTDTLSPSDTLIFIANIFPSKAIKIKRYYWTIDEEILSYDFSFRKNIETPGSHKIVFTLETYLGDTLSDTLTLQVSNQPVLDKYKFIPAARSQGIPSSGGVSFAWDAHDPDSIAELHYRFSIEGFVDTIISEPSFTYWGKLPPLEHIYWNVQAINEFGFVSRDTIHGDFFTRGGIGESGITGAFSTSAATSGADNFDFDIIVSVIDSLGNIAYKKTTKGSSLHINSFSLSPLNAGNYKIVINVPEYPDFARDTLKVSLLENEVLDLDTITLRDITPPHIAAIIAGNEFENIDTLDYSDTLKFCIRDFGSHVSQKNVSAFIESLPLSELSVSGDTVTIVIPSTMRSWNRRQIDIIATDASKNKAIRNFILEGRDSWFKTNPDTTIVSGDSISLYIIDNNHYGFTPDSFYFDIGSKIYAQDAGGIPLYSFSLPKIAFGKRDNVIRSGILYTNGITQWKKWILIRDDISGGTP